MNFCDYDHSTTGEIRRLPIGLGHPKGRNNAAVLVCHDHYVHEQKHNPPIGRPLSWNKLEVVAEEVSGG
jgi:hypothetical protein